MSSKSRSPLTTNKEKSLDKSATAKFDNTFELFGNRFEGSKKDAAN